MARWRKTFFDEVSTRLAQLGLSLCSVCRSRGLSVSRWPTAVRVGGPSQGETPGHDAEVSVLSLIHVECPVCGHVLLFNSERFRSRDTPVFVAGLTEEEEARAEKDSPWQL